MTKAEIVKSITQKTGIERSVVQVTVDELINAIKSNMSQGENIYLRGFGTFEIKMRAQKTARNITKNTAITIPPHAVPKFKPSPEFMDMVKNEQ